MSGVFVANAAANQRIVLQAVRRLADEAGVMAFLVGGPVRDLLLGAPANDLDFTVVGDATTLAQRLSQTIGGRLTVHPRFGTASVAIRDVTADLVTARSESYPSPASLPVVRPGSLTDDLARRDFTINAMALPVSGDNDGLIDPHGGRADLDAGTIRTLHSDSFIDDPTRMLRAIRYEQRFEFRMSGETLTDLESANADGGIARLSGDRVRHEVDRILQELRPLPVLLRAEELEILQAIHPALRASHLHDLIGWQAPPLAWLAALAWALASGAAESVAARLNAPSDWSRVIDDTTTLVDRLGELEADGLLPSTVCALLDGLSPDALAAGIALAPPSASDRIRRYLEEWWTVAPLLRGNDLLGLGVPAGPAIGEALRALRRARLDGLTGSREDEEQLARRWAIESD
jgi:tRNA nucleotidyltransferase (CCA-adding enzyme)